MPRASREIIVLMEAGLHARPAVQLIDEANKYASTITISKKGGSPVQADGKSMMAVMTLEAPRGTPLLIEADGADAEQAVAALVAMFESKFDEL